MAIEMRDFAQGFAPFVQMAKALRGLEAAKGIIDHVAETVAANPETATSKFLASPAGECRPQNVFHCARLIRREGVFRKAGMSTHTTSILNDLIQPPKDGEQGFRDSAAELKSPALKSLAQELSRQRAQFAGELQGLAEALGDESPAESGSVSGALHRGWIQLKSAISSHDDRAILAEAERGEDVAVAAYKDALSKDLAPDVRAVVQQQAAAILVAHNKVKAFRDEVGN